MYVGIIFMKYLTLLILQFLHLFFYNNSIVIIYHPPAG